MEMRRPEAGNPEALPVDYLEHQRERAVLAEIKARQMVALIDCGAVGVMLSKLTEQHRSRLRHENFSVEVRRTEDTSACGTMVWLCIFDGNKQLFADPDLVYAEPDIDTMVVAGGYSLVQASKVQDCVAEFDELLDDGKLPHVDAMSFDYSCSGAEYP